AGQTNPLHQRPGGTTLRAQPKRSSSLQFSPGEYYTNVCGGPIQRIDWPGSQQHEPEATPTIAAHTATTKIKSSFCHHHHWLFLSLSFSILLSSSGETQSKITAENISFQEETKNNGNCDFSNSNNSTTTKRSASEYCSCTSAVYD
ncbi:unnamed protein product, partial [Sphacelaria rigidula]